MEVTFKVVSVIEKVAKNGNKYQLITYEILVNGKAIDCRKKTVFL